MKCVAFNEITLLSCLLLKFSSLQYSEVQCNMFDTPWVSKCDYDKNKHNQTPRFSHPDLEKKIQHLSCIKWVGQLTFYIFA